MVEKRGIIDIMQYTKKLISKMIIGVFCVISLVPMALKAETSEVEKVDEKETPKAELMRKDAYLGTCLGGIVILVGMGWFFSKNKEKLKCK